MRVYTKREKSWVTTDSQADRQKNKEGIIVYFSVYIQAYRVLGVRSMGRLGDRYTHSTRNRQGDDQSDGQTR